MSGLPRERLVAMGVEALEAAGREPASFGLGGCVGSALFACELQRFEPTVACDAWVSRAVDLCKARDVGPSLHRGMAGLGFVLASYVEAEEFLSGLDEALLQALSGLPPASLQSGVAGIGVYASLRSHAATGRALQGAVSQALRVAARPSHGGIVWHSPASYAAARGVDVRREPVTELGMVHGMGGALVALAALAKQGERDAVALARAGLRAVWARERAGSNRFGWIDFGPDGGGGSFELEGARWCVGDIGVLRAVWLAARAVDDEASATRALVLLREHAARAARPAAVSRGDRLDLCCGWAATAQVHLRMHLDTGEDLFREANRRILDGCAASLDALTAPGLRFGRMGVILAMLSAATGEAPAWDGMLGMSVREPEPPLSGAAG